MRPPSPGARFDGPDPGDSAVEQYEALWQTGEPSLERFWARLGPGQSLTLLGTLVKVDLENRFRRGERPSAGEYLERLPELAESSDRAVSLIYEEFCLLEEHGEGPDSARFCDRYAPWRDSLKSQLVYHRELSRVVGAESKPTRYPRPGDRFARYHLRSVLGSGGAARVFLATEDELGGRKVALKLSASIGREPSILANLDHRNIVPILTVTEAEDGLRGFCMPYRPGVTLESLIRRLGSEHAPRSAGAVWEALHPADAGEIEGLEDDRPGWSDFPRSGTYPEAIAWIGLYLAGALAYLHARGVLHRDIKPANVLLAYRDGPQLLDFNLAHAPSDAEHAQAALKGGTLPFMAPEQLRAFLDSSEWDKVGAPADLYSLGLVLRGLLTGQAPDMPDARLPLTRAIQSLLDRRSEPVVPAREFYPAVPPALDSILAKCLAFQPEARYAGAADLAEDLRRFLHRKPLKFAGNPSIIERGVNFLWRNRVVAVVLGVVVLVGASINPIRGLFPPGTAAEAAFSFSENRAFRRAVAELDSNDPAAWERARSAFRLLSQAHPELAWPMLYESVALEKLGVHSEVVPSPRLAEANNKLAEAERKTDFAEVLARRLAEDPRSVTLLVKKSFWIRSNTSGEAGLIQARDVVLKALEVDKDRIDALANLAEIEETLQRPDEAIRHFGRAIEIAEAKPSQYKALATCREKLLLLLTRKADRLVDEGTTPEERRKAEPIYRRAGSMVEALVASWKAGRPGADPAKIEMFDVFYQGSIASGLAAVAADARETEQADRGFREATRQFRSLLALADKYPDSGETFRSTANPRLEWVDRRRGRFLKPE